MATYIDVRQARAMTGLRIVASPGSIAPWSEAIKQILTLKRVPFALVAQKLPGPDLELKEWTAQTSAPSRYGMTSVRAAPGWNSYIRPSGSHRTRR